MATVVTSKDMVELVTTGKVEQKEQLPPLTRERLRLKRDGQPELKAVEKNPESSEKLDDKPKVEVKDPQDGAKPSPDGAKPSAAADEAEDKLPMLSKEREKEVTKIIGKKHRQMKEAQELSEFNRKRADSAERRVRELEARLANGEKPAANPKDSEPTTRAEGDKPKPEDFPNVAEYAEALIEWKEAQREAVRTKQQADSQKAEDDARRAKSAAAWKERLDAVMEETPEYEELVAKAFANSPKVANTVLDTIEESELGPQMLLHLARNPDERATFESLNAEKQIKFLGRLEGKLEAKPKEDLEPEPKAKAKDEPAKTEAKQEQAPAKNVSKAPPPADTSVGTAEPIQKDPSKMTAEEYRAYRHAQRRAASRR